MVSALLNCLQIVSFRIYIKKLTRHIHCYNIPVLLTMSIRLAVYYIYTYMYYQIMVIYSVNLELSLTSFENVVMPGHYYMINNSNIESIYNKIIIIKPAQRCYTKVNVIPE